MQSVVFHHESASAPVAAAVSPTGGIVRDTGAPGAHEVVAAMEELGSR